MRFFLSILLIGLISFQVLAQQGSVAGTVRNASGETLRAAVVRVAGTTIGTVTNVQGVFQLDNIRYGSYQLEVTFIGYMPAFSSFTIDAAHQRITVEFILEEKTESLDEIQVIGDPLSEQKKAGFSIEAVSLTNVRLQSVELNKLLDQTAGVRVRQEGGLGSRVNYSINGLGGRAVRFFMDGVPMEYFGSAFSVNTIPVSMIERMEIYKGVVPASLGSDALGGAVNLITRKNLSNTISASYSIGSFHTHRASLIANYRNTKGLTARLNAFYNYSDNNYRVWGDDIYVTDPETLVVQRGIKVKRFNDGFSSKALKPEVGFTQKKWADQIFLGMLYADLKKELQHGTTMEVPYGEVHYAQQVTMPYVIYQKQNALSKGLDINFFMGYSIIQRNLTDTSRNIYNWYGQIEGSRTLGGERSRSLNELKEKTLLNRISLEYQLIEHHRLGFYYTSSYLTRKEDDPLIVEKSDGYWAPQYINRHHTGLSWQADWLNEKLTTSVFGKGYRYQATIKTSEVVQGITYYSSAHASASSMGYGVAGSYQLSAALQLNVSFEKTYRMPEADEILGDGIIVKSTTTLRPEYSHNFNAGLRWQSSSNKPNRFIFSGNGFLRDVTDLIQQYQYDLGLFVHINFDEVQMQGTDIRFEYKYKDRFSLFQTMAYLHPLIKSDTDELGNNNLLNETRLPNTPFIQTNTEARLLLPNLLQHQSLSVLYINTAYVGEFYKKAEDIGKYNKEKIPAQWTVGLGAAYTFPDEIVSVAIDVNNLFNRQVFDNYAIQKPGRSASIKLTYSLR